MSSGAAAENLDGKAQPWPKLWDRIESLDPGFPIAPASA